MHEVKRKNTASYRFALKFEVKFANFGFKFYAPRPAPQKAKFSLVKFLSFFAQKQPLKGCFCFIVKGVGA
ncbi:hypothetical protein CAMRE0001_3002 [Campylobacter rectus RM3267]|uniref:Uncharacterized protein n=1 Tax=Campylobacter rectus RM3267 TaxID=553218 RepID=B9D612_CAMRE|nr:hypothetical protein CAMRE0001_3002 [Campylobacter rectus RM3267]